MQRNIAYQVIKLLDCFGNNSVREFVLKVSRFPEIASLPSFHYNFPVHFVAQSVICQNNNFRLSVKLAVTSMTANSENLNKQLQFGIDEQARNHSRKSVSGLNTSFSNHLQNEQKSVAENASSSIRRNHEFISKERIVWNEYQFLLLPAALAFLTLIGMQIVLCGFWLSNSITSKFIQWFGRCGHSKKLRPEISHKNTRRKLVGLNRKNEAEESRKLCELSSAKYTMSGKQCFCWVTPAPLSKNNSQVMCTIKQNYANANCLSNLSPLKDYDNINQILNQKPYDSCHRKHHCYQSPLSLKYLAKSNELKRCSFTQAIPDTSTVLCNHLYHSADVTSIASQRYIVPLSVYPNLQIPKTVQINIPGYSERV
ncbi:unnamed protein product [Heterobilharzia americana]|nr:unnamed protein product [Heterobilharzia americana]